MFGVSVCVVCGGGIFEVMLSRVLCGVVCGSGICGVVLNVFFVLFVLVGVCAGWYRLLAQINPIGRCRSPIQLHTGACLKVSSSIQEGAFNVVSPKEDFANFFPQPFLSRSDTAG